MTFTLSNRSKTRRAGVDPRLIEISDWAITLTVVDFGHPQYAGWRTDAEQFALYSAGKSECDGINDLSFHQKGMALDFYAYVDGKASWEPHHLAMVNVAFLQAASMLGHKLEAGILWSGKEIINGVRYGWDCAHIELVEPP